jgi:hypothetical protein
VLAAAEREGVLEGGEVVDVRAQRVESCRVDQVRAGCRVSKRRAVAVRRAQIAPRRGREDGRADAGQVGQEGAGVPSGDVEATGELGGDQRRQVARHDRDPGVRINLPDGLGTEPDRRIEVQPGRDEATDRRQGRTVGFDVPQHDDAIHRRGRGDRRHGVAKHRLGQGAPLCWTEIEASLGPGERLLGDQHAPRRLRHHRAVTPRGAAR